MNNSCIRSEAASTSIRQGVKMKFWGIACVGGKAYKKVGNYRFHLTMAVLDPKSYDPDVQNITVTLSVIQHGQVFLLCVLRHGKTQQVNLNHMFDMGDDVTFIIDGYGTIHLTGYSFIESSNASDMENVQYCPVVELGSEKQILEKLSPVDDVESKKSRRKLLKKAFTGDALNEDDDDDEEDEDFCVEDEDSSIDGSDDDDEEEEEEGEDEEDLEIPEDEIQDVLQDSSEIETPPKFEKSQKRKLEHPSPFEKRAKKEESECKEMELNDDSISENVLDSSIGNTPMPKHLDTLSKSQKKKMRKRLSEISNIGKSKVIEENTSPENTATPKKKDESKKEAKSKFPVVKLEGGVEYQDVIVGRGPVAANGKTVSVFYMGRLENSSIFDARVAPKKPFTFKLGVPEVIPGLDIGIKGMKVGGQRKLKIPPKMGYGSKAVNTVPANSMLYFTVELISVN